MSSTLSYDFNTINRYYETAWVTLDFDRFSDLFAEDAQVMVSFNSRPVETLSRDVFLTRMKHGHFENTANVRVQQLKLVHTAENRYEVTEQCIFQRLGFGQDEDGPGRYAYLGEGRIFMQSSDHRITHMSYNMHKMKTK